MRTTLTLDEDVAAKLKAETRRTGYRALAGNKLVLRDDISVFYANAEKSVRALVTKLPEEKLPRFINALLAGNSADASFKHAYGAKCPDSAAFEKLVNGP